MPIELKSWRLDPVTFEDYLQHVNGRSTARVIVPRQLQQLDEFVSHICYIQGSYLVTGYRGVGKTSFVNYALALVHKQLALQTPPCVLVPIFLNLARSYDVGKLLRRTIRQLYRTLSETLIEGVNGTAQCVSLYSLFPPDLQAELNIAYLKTSAKVSEATTEALKTVIAQATTHEFRIGGETSGGYSLLPEPLPAKVGAKLSGGYSRSKSSSRSEETAKETVDSLEYLEYDDEIAELELVRLIGRLTQMPIELQYSEEQCVVRRFAWFWKLWGEIRRRDYLSRTVLCQETRKLQLVFVFDELDKAEPKEARTMLSALKPVLVSSKATFIFVGGYEFANQWLGRTQPEGGMLYSLFTDIIYISLCDDDEIESFAQALVQKHSDQDCVATPLLEHLKLHCGGTLRGVFRQVLPLVHWDSGKPMLDEDNADDLYTKVFEQVREIDAQIPKEHPPQIRDNLKRLSYTWLMMAEREQRFIRQHLYDPEKIARGFLGRRWQLAVDAHFQVFWEKVLENSVFRATDQGASEWYEFNSEFSLGNWIHFKGTGHTFLTTGGAEDTGDSRPEVNLVYMPPPFPDPVIIPPPGALPSGSRVSFACNSRFVGREGEFREVASTLLQPSQSAVSIPQLVSGMGGIGKTQFAVEFAYRYGRFFKGVHWINAGNLERIGAEIAACGLAQGVNPWPETLPEQIAATLRAWAVDSLRLVILDNLEDEKAAKEWLTKLVSSGVHILITARVANWAKDWNLKQIVLDTLPSALGCRFIRNVFSNIRTGDPDNDLDALVTRLGHLPLALHLAAQYLLAHPKLSIPAYLARLLVTDLNLLQVAFDISWNQLSDEKAQQVLGVMAYCAPNVPIPTGLLRRASGIEDLATFDMALAQLVNNAFIQKNNTQLPVIHSLVAEYVRIKIAKDKSTFLNPLMDALEESSTLALQSGRPENFAPLQPHLEVVLSFMEDFDQGLSGKTATLWNNLGAHLQSIAEYAGASAAYEKALQMDEAMYDPEHPNVARDLLNLGSVLENLGDYSGARSRYERALSVFERDLGPVHPNVAVCLNNLGSVLNDLGDLAGARVAFERALRIDEAVYGPEHPEVATTVNNLGGVLNGLGDLAGARAAFERALRIDEAVYGPEHPEVATAVNNLGSVLRSLGDLAGAQAAYERALRIDEAVYGPEHPNVATTVNNLGLVLQDLGDFAAAQACYERALRMDEATFGPGHPNVAIRINNLGLVLQDLGDLVGARACLERALTIVERVYGAKHPNLASVLENLGGVLLALGDLDGARECYEHAQCIWENQLPSDSDLSVNSIEEEKENG